MASTIGIKIANGEFYSIVEENSPVKKRLILTTVHDKQRSVQIDLYKSYTRTMADALYIGSLVVENIKARPKGEPSIELVISSARNGEITADAADMDTSSGAERQILNVSLTSLEDDARDYEIPDFEFEQAGAPPAGLYEEPLPAEEKKGFPWFPVICAALLVTAIALALWLFFFRSGKGRESPAAASSLPARETAAPPEPVPAESAPPPVSAPPPPVVQAPAAPPPVAEAPQTPPPVTAPPPVITAPASPPPESAPPSRKRSVPVASYRVPAQIPRGGAPYRIRWGDTLWDISEAFYRNPWLYPRIARFNNIRNPDLIISGRTIRIPPRN